MSTAATTQQDRHDDDRDVDRDIGGAQHRDQSSRSVLTILLPISGGISR
jgi:hypothetical protein